ncbi:hypothetical protein GCM10027515_26720 [Schumannella luteola]|uniref:Uncharacterized protein n=1 Tax=Schumannella luteola TaxID=472059 RepID=A0A852YEF3_9MICO|nr:helix-turn-helix domain-containing protein [Schumannella luteola]NYG99531.1 hypothetical protein [Schumannella luteola]TPX03850.1 helix-turn-helix domain-containing protein [Schumannella luteola]
MHTPPKPNGKAQFADLLGRWLMGQALRHLNAAHAAGSSLDLEALTALLIEDAGQAADHIHQSQQGVRRAAGTTWTQVEGRTAPRAAERALQVWRADFFENRAAMGRKSGQVRRGKRQAKFLGFQLGDLEGLSIREQAARLGCSTATVSRLRKERAAFLASQVEPDRTDLPALIEESTVIAMTPEEFSDFMHEYLATEADARPVAQFKIPDFMPQSSYDDAMADLLAVPL